MKEFKLPEKWFILSEDLPKANWQIVVDYFNEGCDTDTYSIASSGFFYPNFIDGEGFLNGGHSGSVTELEPYNQYKEITYNQFLKYVLDKDTLLEEPQDNTELNQILIKLLTE